MRYNQLYFDIWKTIHIMTLTLNTRNNKSKEAFTVFINCLIVLMPELSSRVTLSYFLKTHPLQEQTLFGFTKYSSHMSSKESLFRWGYLLHSYANEIARIETGVRNSTISLKRARQQYLKIPPNVWGPRFWGMLHGLAAVYVTGSRRHKAAFRNLLESLKILLPCNRCCQHYIRNIAKVNMDDVLKNQPSLFYFIFVLHNAVNKENGKHAYPFRRALRDYNLQHYIGEGRRM